MIALSFTLSHDRPFVFVCQVGEVECYRFFEPFVNIAARLPEPTNGINPLFHV